MSLMSFVRSMFLMSLMLTYGCQDSDVKYQNLVPVNGKVTLDSKALNAVTVIFESKNGIRAFGKTDESGNFELEMRGHGKGVLPDTYLVKVDGESVPIVYQENGVTSVTIAETGNTPVTIDLKSRATLKDNGISTQTAQQ